MNLFIALAAALTLLAALLILWPLLRKPQVVTDEARTRRDINRQIYNERIAQIDQEEGGGRLSAEQAIQLRDEAGKRLIDDVAQLRDASTPGMRGQRWLGALAVILLLPLLSIALYLQSDSWMLVDESKEQPAWDYLVKRLEQRVADAPTDTEALLMLARTRRAQGDNAGAIEAYARLNRISDYRVAEYLADEAETRILAQQGAFPATARKRLQQALAANPVDGRALWYSGLAAMSMGDTGKARDHWLQLAQQELPESFRKVLHQQLTQLGLPADQLPQAAGAAAAGPRLQLNIDARPELIAGLSPDTPVFVMARPADGSRAMLAVRKHRLDELPLQTVLTDGMNMAGGLQLSDFDAYRIVVRVAVSGDALPQSGDPFAQTEASRAEGVQGVSLTLDKRWP